MKILIRGKTLFSCWDCHFWKCHLFFFQEEILTMVLYSYLFIFNLFFLYEETIFKGTLASNIKST